MPVVVTRDLIVSSQLWLLGNDNFETCIGTTKAENWKDSQNYKLTSENIHRKYTLRAVRSDESKYSLLTFIIVVSMHGRSSQVSSITYISWMNEFIRLTEK